MARKDATNFYVKLVKNGQEYRVPSYRVRLHHEWKMANGFRALISLIESCLKIMLKLMMMIIMLMLIMMKPMMKMTMMMMTMMKIDDDDGGDGHDDRSSKRCRT